ncbi:MAG: hypothetical protein LBQ32_09270 [Burkholderiaceae bacterium]|nr:hypothetical protein [Burkholderiaceae bacterium]
MTPLAGLAGGACLGAGLLDKRGIHVSDIARLAISRSERRQRLSMAARRL